MKANTTNDSDENVREMTSAKASLVSELDTVPIAGARILALSIRRHLELVRGQRQDRQEVDPGAEGRQAVTRQQQPTIPVSCHCVPGRRGCRRTSGGSRRFYTATGAFSAAWYW